MINTIYTNIIESKNTQNIQEFCDSFGVDGYLDNDDVYRIDVNENRKVFNSSLVYLRFESDLRI
jgi:hypothetical protein